MGNVLLRTQPLLDIKEFTQKKNYNNSVLIVFESLFGNRVAITLGTQGAGSRRVLLNPRVIVPQLLLPCQIHYHGGSEKEPAFCFLKT